MLLCINKNLRTITGTRWLTRWDKELNLFVKLCYYGFTTGAGTDECIPHTTDRLIYYSAATQTLGEEYTGIWQYSPSTQTVPPSSLVRTALIILSLVPSYFIARLGQNVSLNNRHPNAAKWLNRLPSTLDVVTEIHLALFYLRGNYYDLVKRILGIHHVCVLHLYILVLILIFPQDILYSRGSTYTISILLFTWDHDRRQTHSRVN